MIVVTPDISIDESELQVEFVRASGPGGQNVNKVATAVQLRFDVRHSPSLPADIRERLTRLAGRRMTEDGVLIINARRHRTQQANRRDAIGRLVKLIERASVPPKPRRKTKPTGTSKEKRLQEKRRRSSIKRMRKPVPSDDD